jgi:hypothetical protein
MGLASFAAEMKPAVAQSNTPEGLAKTLLDNINSDFRALKGEQLPLRDPRYPDDVEWTAHVAVPYDGMECQVHWDDESFRSVICSISGLSHARADEVYNALTDAVRRQAPMNWTLENPAYSLGREIQFTNPADSLKNISVSEDYPPLEDEQTYHIAVQAASCCHLQ